MLNYQKVIIITLQWSPKPPNGRICHMPCSGLPEFTSLPHYLGPREALQEPRAFCQTGGGFPAHLSFDRILGRVSTEAEVNGCLVSAGFTVMKRAGEPSQLCRESADALFVAINARDSAHDQIHWTQGIAERAQNVMHTIRSLQPAFLESKRFYPIAPFECKRELHAQYMYLLHAQCKHIHIHLSMYINVYTCRCIHMYKHGSTDLHNRVFLTWTCQNASRFVIFQISNFVKRRRKVCRGFLSSRICSLCHTWTCCGDISIDRFYPRI